MRCAIYARYSSDLQRDSSIEDQIRKCREYATSRGWTIQEQHIRCDRAVSAGSMAGRDGLTALMADAKQKPRPFDYILIDDTSRLARNLEDSLRTAKQLDFYGVKVFFVSQGIDSGDKSSRTMLTMHGMIDEQFIQRPCRQSSSRTGRPGAEGLAGWGQVLRLSQQSDRRQNADG